MDLPHIQQQHLEWKEGSVREILLWDTSCSAYWKNPDECELWIPEETRLTRTAYVTVCFAFVYWNFLELWEIPLFPLDVHFPVLQTRSGQDANIKLTCRTWWDINSINFPRAYPINLIFLKHFEIWAAKISPKTRGVGSCILMTAMVEESLVINAHWDVIIHHSNFYSVWFRSHDQVKNKDLQGRNK